MHDVIKFLLKINLNKFWVKYTALYAAIIEVVWSQSKIQERYNYDLDVVTINRKAQINSLQS